MVSVGVLNEVNTFVFLSASHRHNHRQLHSVHDLRHERDGADERLFCMNEPRGLPLDT